MVDSGLIGGQPGLPPRGADLPGNQPCGVTGGAAPCRAGSAGASWVRELMPSLGKTFRRGEATVARLINSCAAISRVDAPSPAQPALSASFAGKASRGSTGCCPAGVAV